MRLLTLFSFAVALSLVPSSLAQAPVPRPAGPFKIAPPAGKAINVSDYRGDVVMIQFLFTSCSHCQATAREFTKLQQEFGPHGLHILGAAFNEDAVANPALVQQFVAENHVGFPVGLVAREKVLQYLGFSVMTRFGVPQIMLIDRKGKIRAQSVPQGSPELQDPAKLRPLLEKLLKESK